MASRTPSRSGSRGRSATPRRSASARSKSNSHSPARDGPSNGQRERDRPSRSYSRSRTPPRRDRSNSRTASRSTKIVVQKLSKNVNTDHLREIFGVYGPIKDIDMPLNKAFMTNRGTAFIVFHETADAEAAIASMHEAQLDGTLIDVSIVLPKRRFSRSPPPSRRVANHMNRFDRGPRSFRGPPTGPSAGYRSPPGRRGPSPRRMYGRSGREGSDPYRRRSYTRSRTRSPAPRRRTRSPSYSRSPSRSPPPRREYRSRDSPPRRSGGGGGGGGSGRRRRSRTPSSYDSYSRSRSRSRSRDRAGYRRR